MKWSISSHRPPHLYIDGTWYFVTASTVGNAHILISDKHFIVWLDILQKLTTEFMLKMVAWVALQNHYHLLFLPNAGHEIGNFMKRLNGGSSYQLNQLDNTSGRSVWYSYCDTCIRDERDFWTRFNYIHYNPIKHGYTQNPEDWEFSSHGFYLREEGGEWLTKCWAEFSVPDSIENDQF